MSEEKKNETQVEFKEKKTEKIKSFAKKHWKKAVAGAAIAGAAVGGFMLGKRDTDSVVDFYEPTESSGFDAGETEE